jgi:hypothetical protein
MVFLVGPVDDVEKADYVHDFKWLSWLGAVDNVSGRR